MQNFKLNLMRAFLGVPFMFSGAEPFKIEFEGELDVKTKQTEFLVKTNEDAGGYVYFLSLIHI